MPPMPTPCHLVIGTDHPFSNALATALQLAYGEAAVRTGADTKALSSLGAGEEISSIYLLSSLFPCATAEHPAVIWHRSVRELVTVLDFARDSAAKVFWPSSIAVFGSSAPTEQCQNDAPQETT